MKNDAQLSSAMAPAVSPAPQRSVLGQQQQQRQQQQQQQQKTRTWKRGPAQVTRVVGDLMVFIELDDDGNAEGLVFKPDKLDRYCGEQLSDVGVYEGATLARVEWDPETRLVHRVVVHEVLDRPLTMEG